MGDKESPNQGTRIGAYKCFLLTLDASKWCNSVMESPGPGGHTDGKLTGRLAQFLGGKFLLL